MFSQMVLIDGLNYSLYLKVKKEKKANATWKCERIKREAYVQNVCLGM